MYRDRKWLGAGAAAAIHYGGIGVTNAHEIARHFDAQGSQYDESGVLRELWTVEDRERFNQLGQRLVEQYNQHERLPGHRVKGDLTLDENIADIAGFTIAYEAYRASIGGVEPPLLDGLTGDQRFFLGYAQFWRGKYREENMLQRLMTDTHAPDEQRVSAVRNLDAWYDAFDISPEDDLYLPPEQRAASGRFVAANIKM